MSVKLMDCTLRDGANVVGKGFDAEITDMVLDGLTAAGVPIIEFGNAGGIGAYEVAGFTQAETDDTYLEIAQKYLNRGSEIGMIRSIHTFDKATVDLINAELDIRYFTPVIHRITSAKEKFGYNYWEAETSAGKVSIVLNNPFSNIRVLEDGRIYIFDMDGNCFLIPDPTKLDRLTYRTIEIYL